MVISVLVFPHIVSYSLQFGRPGSLRLLLSFENEGSELLWLRREPEEPKSRDVNEEVENRKEEQRRRWSLPLLVSSFYLIVLQRVESFPATVNHCCDIII